MPYQMMIAGASSGVGKTTLALGLSAALIRRGLRVQPFKVGPDFIDPGYLTQAAARRCRNLDGWMLTREYNRQNYYQHLQGMEVGLIEGVMGLYDGYDGQSEAGSSAQIAKWLDTPVILVVDARAMARSAGALVLGFEQYDPELRLLGVIFNRVGSATHAQCLRQALTGHTRLPVLGCLPWLPELNIPERHLGLITQDENPLPPPFLERLAVALETHLDLDLLLSLSHCPPWPLVDPISAAKPHPPRVRWGIARDQAFCFYYPENLEHLAAAGAELINFSPLQDKALPSGLNGIYLGGGFPEVFAQALTDNIAFIGDLRRQAARGLVIYAECGGLMYLSQGITTVDGNFYPLGGLLPFRTRMLPRLRALGYVKVTLEQDCLVGKAGAQLRGHEFHYSEIEAEPSQLRRHYRLLAWQGGLARREGYGMNEHLLASYIHLHFGSHPDIAPSLVAAAPRSL